MPAKSSPQQRAKARACREAGCSLKEAGRQAGVSEMSVQRWEKAAAEAGDPWIAGPAMGPAGVAAGDSGLPPAGNAADLLAAADHLGDGAITGSTLDVLRGMLQRTLRLARTAEQTGNLTAAQRAGRDAGELAKVVARLEKAEQGDADILRISRADIAEGMAAIEARFKAITARPLLCADCGRKLAAEWGHETPKDEDPA